LAELDAIARRVKRVATGWEPTLTIAMDGLISMRVMHELVERFLEDAPPTRLRLQSETLSGTWNALLAGRADLSLGAAADAANRADVDVQVKPLGEMAFVFAVAPHHPLARAPEPISNRDIQAHRIVAVADSSRGAETVTVGILPGQDVLTVSTLADKLHAQMRGLGCGYLPAPMVAPHASVGRLVIKKTERSARTPKLVYAWRKPARGQVGNALAWWLDALGKEKTRAALLSQFQ
jgi:DNA-binding transcriptional LysR family regulator